MIDVETIFDSDREEYEFMQDKKEQQMKEQIEEMAMLISGNEIQHCGHRDIAERLYNAGYRKQSEIEKVENKLFLDGFESVLFSLVYLGGDGKWHTKRNNAEKTTAIVERCINLITTMKGGAE